MRLQTYLKKSFFRSLNKSLNRINCSERAKAKKTLKVLLNEEGKVNDPYYGMTNGL